MPSKPTAKTTRRTSAHPESVRTAIRVGIGGWTFAPWRDTFYPADLIQRRELEYASRQLQTIEINGTFYRAQSPAVYAKWAAETPDEFVFSVKAPRGIVQSRRLGDMGARVERFIGGGLAELGARLGPILWQFRPTRVFDRDDLAAFLDALPRTLAGRPLRHVLEVRHASFACAAYVDLARTHGVATVFTDSTEYPSLADLTGDFVYARLMRSKAAVRTGYAAGALSKWADHATEWAAGRDPGTLPHVGASLGKAQPRDVFIYFISSAKERNPAAAIALQKKVDTR